METDGRATPPGSRGGGGGAATARSGLESIKVFCRFAPHAANSPRPPVTRGVTPLPDGGVRVSVAEGYNGTVVAVDCERAFEGHSSQDEVHSAVTQPLVPRVVAGYNATLLAFGQTASGKTHTMLGPCGGRIEYLRDEVGRGLIPRTIDDVFREVRRRQGSGEIRERVGFDLAFFEVYNEQIYDLIAKATSAPPPGTPAFSASEPSSTTFNSSASGFSFKGTSKHRFDRDVSRVEVSSADEALRVLEATLTVRQLGGTNLNEASSRGHSVVQLRVRTGVKRATLSLVDLAGSECVKKSGAQGARRHEAKNINTSLFALKQVMAALLKRREHVPYGDSLLTRVLSDSLGGNSHLRFLVCCTSREEDVQETMQTLRFAGEASGVLRRAPTVAALRPGPLDAPNFVLASREEPHPALQERNAFLETQCAALQRQVLQLQETNAVLMQQMHDRQQQTTVQVSALEHDHSAKERELEQARSDLAVARREVERQRSHSENLSRKLCEAQQRMDTIAGQIQDVAKENDSLRSQVRTRRREPPTESTAPPPPRPQEDSLQLEDADTQPHPPAPPLAGVQFLEELQSLHPFVEPRQPLAKERPWHPITDERKGLRPVAELHQPPPRERASWQMLGGAAQVREQVHRLGAALSQLPHAP
eukprot:Hpha_TRINITY_DN16626_c5_g1::TRINITY_DN16626_c5_g1_i1::g.178348::m.178348/K10396/KIF5; kinesin family member 5